MGYGVIFSALGGTVCLLAPDILTYSIRRPWFPLLVLLLTSPRLLIGADRTCGFALDSGVCLSLLAAAPLRISTALGGL